MTKKAAKDLDPGSARLLRVRELIAQLGGARLCYGDPIRVGERSVIPVARVRTAGGGGFGSGGDDEATGGGGGGGGWLDAIPLGFIDAGPEGARFERIPDPEAPVRMLKGGAAALATVVTTIAGVRALRSRRRGGALGSGPRGLLGR